MPTHPHAKPPEYILKSVAVLNCIGSGKHLLSEVAFDTAFAETTVIRIAAQLVEDEILEAHLVDGDVEVSIRNRSL